jgi:hypothetical protein
MPEQGNLIRVRSITLQQFMDTPLKDKKKKGICYSSGKKLLLIIMNLISMHSVLMCLQAKVLTQSLNSSFNTNEAFWSYFFSPFKKIHDEEIKRINSN